MFVDTAVELTLKATLVPRQTFKSESCRTCLACIGSIGLCFFPHPRPASLSHLCSSLASLFMYGLYSYFHGPGDQQGSNDPYFDTDYVRLHCCLSKSARTLRRLSLSSSPATVVSLALLCLQVACFTHLLSENMPRKSYSTFRNGHSVRLPMSSSQCPDARRRSDARLCVWGGHVGDLFCGVLLAWWHSRQSRRCRLCPKSIRAVPADRAPPARRPHDGPTTVRNRRGFCPSPGSPTSISAALQHFLVCT